MADLEKTVKIIFEGEDKALASAADNVAQKFGDLSVLAGTVTEPLAKMADAVMRVDAALAALAVGGMALAIRESSKFNQGFALISTSVDASGQDLKNYRQNILNYASDSTRSIEDINAALYTAAQAGIKWSESLEFMARAEELAVSNNANLNTTVDLLTGTMNAYGYTIKDVKHLNDVLFTSTLIGKQTIDSLGQSMGQVVGIAANFGVSFEQLSAAITTLTAKGMETSEAITGVKGVIATIVQPSQETAKAAQAMGLNFSAAALKAQGLSGVLANVMRATGGSSDKMALLFNEVRALNGAMQITGDGMKFFNSAMEEINNSTGAAEKAYKKMSETFQNQSQRVVNTAKTMMIEVGNRLEPAAAGLAGKFADLLKGVKVGVDSGAFDPMFEYLDKAAKEIGEWLAKVAAQLPRALEGLDFGKLISSLQELGRAFGLYLGDIDLTTMDGLHRFIQGIIDGIAGLIQVTAGMVDGFRPFFTAIKEFLAGLAASDVEAQKMAGTVMALAKAAETFGLGLAAAAKVVNEYGVDISGTFNAIAGGAQIMWNGLQILFNGIGMAFIVLEKSVLEFFNILSGGFLGRFSETFRKLQETVEESGLKLREAFVQNGMDAARGMDRMTAGLGALSTQTSATGEKVSAAGQKIKSMATDTQALDKAVTGATGKIDGIKESLEDLPDKKQTSVVVKADEKALADTEDTIYRKFGQTTMKITTNLDGTTTIENMNRMNSAFPEEKNVEIKPDITQTAMAEIKAQSEIIQRSIEWKARLDIAQVEAAAKEIEAAFESVKTTVESTGKTITDLAGAYVATLTSGSGGSSVIERQIQEESRRRDEALKMQKELVEAEVKNLDARTDAMRAGRAMIEIDGKGLQPQLEAFMFEILKAIQVRANAEGIHYLVGL